MRRAATRCSCLLLVVAAGACSSSSTGGSTSSSGGSGTSGTSGTSGASGSSGTSGNVNITCNSPGGATTLCDVQNPSSPNHPAPLSEVTFPDPLVVTSDVFTLSSANGMTTKAFFVSEGEGGPYRAGLVKGDATIVDAVGLTRGSQVNLTIRVEEFTGTGTASETQLVLVGGTALPTPGTIPGATVAPVGSFGSDAGGEPYEGVLVRVENVTTERFTSGARLEYGAFRLQGGLLVDDQFFKYDAGLGETFTSITGFVRYTYDGHYALLPRDAADVVSSGNPLTPAATDITQIQDPANITSLPHCVPPAECDLVRLTNMVVTSSPRVADKDGAGKAILYSVFVQDPSKLDGNGEPLPYSGMKVVFARTGLTTAYTFAVYGDFDFPDTRDNPDTWPKPGDVVTIVGTPQEYFDHTQLGAVRELTRVGAVTDSPSPVAVNPLAKTISGAALDGLAAGTRGVLECVTAVAPGADTEKWEGVLVKLTDVTTTLACVPTSTNSTEAPACVLEDFGYFRVTGGIEIGTSQGVFFAGRCEVDTCTCDGANGTGRVPSDERLLGKAFTSITGILDFSFDVFRVSPRTDADLVAAP